MTMINDKIMRDKETSIAAIFEADKVAICARAMIKIYYNIEFSHIILIADQLRMINICSLFCKQQNTISNNI